MDTETATDAITSAITAAVAEGGTPIDGVVDSGPSWILLSIDGRHVRLTVEIVEPLP